MIERTATIGSSVGLHARPAAIFAEAASDYDFDITIARRGEPGEDAGDASSILTLMGLGAGHGEVVVLRSEDAGAQAALDAMAAVLETDHDAS